MRKCVKKASKIAFKKSEQKSIRGGSLREGVYPRFYKSYCS